MLVFWTEDKVKELRELHGWDYSAAYMAAKLGTTRDAVLGKIFRLGLSKSRPALPPSVREDRKKEHHRKLSEKRRQIRWERNPLLAERKSRARTPDQLSEARKIMNANGARKTSAEYRKHLPKQPEMTRGELRAMLTQAVVNTAEMS